jgi:DNA-binding IclR family transcriptional regulator
MSDDLAPLADRTAPAASPAASGIKSLAKGLRALRMLIEVDDLGTVEVARALGVDKSAASRILRTLADAGFAVQGAGRRYRAAARLAGAHPGATPFLSGGSVRERARPLLEHLHRITSETVTLAVRADDQVLYLDKIAAEQPLRVERPIGTLSPLHCTALGKVFLAWHAAPMPATLTAYTPNTPVTRAALQAQLDRFAAQGYAVDDEELAPGIRCVAAPLRDPASGALVAALGVSGPTARIASPQLETLGRLVKDVAGGFGR